MGSVPRGIALRSNDKGAPVQAWVLNAVENSLSHINLSDPEKPVVTSTIKLDDPTPARGGGVVEFNGRCNDWFFRIRKIDVREGILNSIEDPSLDWSSLVI